MECKLDSYVHKRCPRVRCIFTHMFYQYVSNVKHNWVICVAVIVIVALWVRRGNHTYTNAHTQTIQNDFQKNQCHLRWNYFDLEAKMFATTKCDANQVRRLGMQNRRGIGIEIRWSEIEEEIGSREKNGQRQKKIKRVKGEKRGKERKREEKRKQKRKNEKKIERKREKK